METKTICDYVDSLLSTWNPMLPSQSNWSKSIVHPCKQHYLDLSHDEQCHDYVNLLNTVQRHTRCSTNYCLKRKDNESDLKCRFNYPFNLCDKTKLEFEKIHTKDRSTQYRAKIITQRNDPWLNNHQRVQLQGWRANCDIQVVIDHHACVEYLAKYAAKGEPKSQQLKDTFNAVIKSSSLEDEPNKLIKKLMMKSLGEWDFSAQETMHHFLSLKLHSTTFHVKSFSLNGSRRLQKSGDAKNKNCTNDSFLHIYANRKVFSNKFPDIMKTNFLEFATKY